MKTSHYLALAVFFVYAMHTCTLAKTIIEELNDGKPSALKDECVADVVNAVNLSKKLSSSNGIFDKTKYDKFIDECGENTAINACLKQLGEKSNPKQFAHMCPARVPNVLLGALALLKRNDSA